MSGPGPMDTSLATTSPHDLGEEVIPQPLASVLARVDRRALGVAVGTVLALGVFLLTIDGLLRRPEPSLNLDLLGQYFPGYSVSWTGALAGLGWAFAVGFCAGWLLAFVRNFAVAAWIFVVRSRHELAMTRDLLDHM
jgi:hypothetical protein